MTHPDAPPPDAASVFDDYLRQIEQGVSVDFEAICRAHPTLAPELRRHEATRRLLERLLPGPLDGEDDAQQSAATNAAQADVDASFRTGDRLATDPDTNAGSASELLGRLRRQSSSNSRYQVLGEIARGGMGIVLRVFDSDLRRKLAMKVARGKDETVEAGTPTDPRTIGRFLEEAQITSQLDHPGIVPVHEIGIGEGGHPFFTMRLVRGETLRDIFDRVANDDEEWTQVRAVGVLQKVCEAMSYAHDKKVIHRDLKPANVMVGQFGEVYVMDWGLARVIDRDDPHDIRIRTAAHADGAGAVSTERHRDGPGTPGSLVTMDGQVLGTPAYMSPEQAMGRVEKVGPQSDVYGVGAMLYHLIAGQMPYVPNDARLSGEAVRSLVVHGPPRPLHEFGRTAPQALVAICEKAMARELEHRYVDMRALAIDLRAYTEVRVVAAYETGSWAETRMWVRRNKGLAAMSVAAVVAAVACVFIVLRNFESSRLLDLQAKMADVLALTRLGVDRQGPGYGRVKQSRWREDAQRLVASIREVEEELVGLRAGKQRTQEHIEEAKQAFLRGAELETKEKELLWRQRMLGQEQFPAAADVLPAVEARMQAVHSAEDIEGLNVEIFAMVRPDDARRTGNERLALLLAERMVQKAKHLDCYRATHRDTLAFAYFRIGDLDRAVSEQEVAVGESEDLRDNLDILRAKRVEWSNRAMQHRILDRLAADVKVLQAERENDSWSRALAPETTATWHDEVGRLLADLLRLDCRLRMSARAQNELAWAESWARAIPAIRANPKYAALVHVVPQEDLLPLDADPVSQLWEFAHLPSGEPPAPRVNDRLTLEVHTGLVFVLLPGGTIPCEEGTPQLPVHDVALDPFFISKFEVTAQQAMRLGGNWWGRFSAADSRDKMMAQDDLSWQDCTACLAKAGGWIHLPTGAQWEYACRAGSATPNWRSINVNRLMAHLAFDGVPASVGGTGKLGANPFGLHDMIGNVQEWCSDGTNDRAEPRPGDGLRLPRRSSRRWLRGGHSQSSPDELPMGYVPGSPYDLAHHFVDSDEDGDNDFDWGQVVPWRACGGMRPARPLLQ